MEIVSCIISDDEEPARDLLKHYIGGIPGLKLAASFAKGSDTFNFLQSHTVDLLFLDINMPGMTGVEMIKTITRPPGFIFTTAYPQFAVEAFELNAVDYLTKPISEERFRKAVAKFMRNHPAIRLNDLSLPVKIDRKVVRIPLADIHYIKAYGNYTRIFLGDRKMLMTHTTIASIRKLLPTDKFVQVHRSFIVAREKIFTYSATSVTISGTILPVGRNYREQFGQTMSE